MHALMLLGTASQSHCQPPGRKPSQSYHRVGVDGYLIGEDGVIARDVAVGTDAILDLLTKPGSQLGSGEFSLAVRPVGDLVSTRT